MQTQRQKTKNTVITRECTFSSFVKIGWWFSPCKEMENDRIAKRVYVWECEGSRSEVDRYHEGLFKKKKGRDVRQEKRMLHDRNEWWGCVRGNAWGVAQGMNP